MQIFFLQGVKKKRPTKVGVYSNIVCFAKTSFLSPLGKSGGPVLEIKICAPRRKVNISKGHIISTNKDKKNISAHIISIPLFVPFYVSY